jgi:hypothetical protein
MSDLVIDIFDAVTSTGGCLWDLINIKFLSVLLNFIIPFLLSLGQIARGSSIISGDIRRELILIPLRWNFFIPRLLSLPQLRFALGNRSVTIEKDLLTFLY